MLTGMSTFLLEFSNLMKAEPFGNPHRFHLASGAATSQLTDIAKGRKLPTPGTLTKWLKKARVNKDTIERLVFLSRLEKARANPDLGPLFAYFLKERREILRLLESIVEICRQRGMNLPEEILQGVHAVKANYE